MLNRDTFASDAVKEMISANFIFMQVYDVGETGRKLMTFYKVHKLPAILVIDPVTGALMQDMDGFVAPERLEQRPFPCATAGKHLYPECVYSCHSDLQVY